MLSPSRIIIRLLLPCVLLVCGSFSARAQFKEAAFSQTYNDPADTTFASDTTDKLFSFKDYFGGLGHKRKIKIGTLFAGSIIFIGGEQIYNKDYWKLPIVYGLIGTGVGVGTYEMWKYNNYGNEEDKNWAIGLYVGAGVAYWGTLLDGVICYDRSMKGLPGRATIYSILVPGLGQAYNGEFWKVPVYDALIAGSIYFFVTNRTNYLRYREIYQKACEPGYSGPITADKALYYRDYFRRYRDYSLLAMVGFYLLQVIDANVFAYMRDFEIADDIAMDMSVGVINPTMSYALSGSKYAPGSSFCAPCTSFGSTALTQSTRTTLFGGNAVGLTVAFKFK